MIIPPLGDFIYRRMEIMKGMMLGILDGIFSVITKAIMTVLSPVVEYILGPIITLFVNLISYIFGIYFYGISSFLLGLIDFVELLFRALAGLEASNAHSEIILSLDGKSGDLLVQLIRHPDIQQAFLSMCIVGLFLLVVTTVFQIIKVEYTTEGAKNSKTPIFQKAFKGLANLMLLPILCVFGVIFSNQLLGLLDKATKGEGDNPTIAGTLFVTAASDAFYREGEVELVFYTSPPSMYPMQIVTNVVGIAINSLGSFGSDIVQYDRDFKIKDEKERSNIELQFMNQAENYCYYSIENVSGYYNYSQINYLLLIFGGCVVLKCLYFTCFGMVVRLYKCAVLFIISPAVIGMTPVNEGGLGKWRGQFIGQVLSAYGTVLSLNLFFIIVRVLLNVDVTFVNKNSLGNSPFSSSLMTGLLKSIFVIAGCILIEKFSKELGGFFGAEDAMSTGKDMSKQVADVAMKGVQVAQAVGGAAMTGGVSLLKSGKGIANNIATGAKMGKGDSKGFKGGLKAVAGGISGALGQNDKKAASIYASEEGQSKAKARANRIKENKGKLSALENSDEYTSLTSKEKAAQEKLDSIKAENAKLGLTTSDEQKAAEKELRGIAQDRASFEYRNNMLGLKHDINNDEADAKLYGGAQGRIDEKKQKRADSLSRGALYAASVMAQSGEDVKGFIPGYKQFFQPTDKAAHSGSKLLGDHAEQAMAKIDKDRQKKVEDAWMQKGTIAEKAAETLQGSAANTFMREFIDEFKAAQQNVTNDARDTIRQLKDAVSSIKSDNNMGEEAKAQRISELTQSAVDQLNGRGANVTYSQVSDWALSGKLDINLSDLKMDFDTKKFDKAIADALKKSGGTMNADVLRDELQKVFNELGEKGNKNMLMQIESIIKKVMNDLK